MVKAYEVEPRFWESVLERAGVRLRFGRLQLLKSDCDEPIID